MRCSSLPATPRPPQMSATIPEERTSRSGSPHGGRRTGGGRRSASPSACPSLRTAGPRRAPASARREGQLAVVKAELGEHASIAAVTCFAG
jgi:hypothetical protein